jgi:glyoxylase-like metal-dependent hydrolase (beta-lactamase superfamily II)
MLHVDTFGPVTRITLARRILGVQMRSVSLYVVNGFLIDSGPPAVVDELAAWLERNPVHLVFNTHHHEDHAGGDKLLGSEFGLRILANPSTVELVSDLPPVHLYRRAVWGTPETAVIEAVDGEIEVGGLVFEQIPTPGHSPDHVSLFERRHGWLFGGDIFIHERVRYLRPDEDLLLEIQSLKRALALQPQVLFCAHAGIFTDPAAAIRRKLGFWAEILHKSRALLAHGLSASEISRQVLGAEDLLTATSLGHFAKTTLVKALLALPEGELRSSGG